MLTWPDLHLVEPVLAPMYVCMYNINILRLPTESTDKLFIVLLLPNFVIGPCFMF